MVAIISSDKDISTNQVIDWLNYYQTPFLRINGEDRLELVHFNLNNKVLDVRIKNISTDSIFNLSDISCVWYRRGDIVFQNQDNINNKLDKINAFVKEEYKILHDFIFKYFESLPQIDNYFLRGMNKIHVLFLASKCGLKIPFTELFENNMPSLEGDCEYITKSISEVFYIEKGINTYATPTALVDLSRLNDISQFSLSKIQKKIEKECDLRIFYLDGFFYSMAIMSQNNEESKIDFRFYPTEPPNRSFSFSLPIEIKSKLDELMKTIGLDSGSIDLVLDTKGEYYFLEINPVGQFGMTSYPCNYFIERQIARQLTELANNKFKN